MTTIIGIQLSNRMGTATDVQKVLTDYGCYIKTRLGMHNLPENGCANNGLIILDVPNDEKSKELIEKLDIISGTEVQSMTF